MDLGRRVVVIGGGFVAFDAARTALRVGREEERAGARRARRRDRRAPEGSARLGARGAARRRHRGHGRLARELRRDAGAAHHAGARGVRGGAARRRRASSPAAARARFLGNGHAAAVELREVLSVFDANGRFAPVYDDDDISTIEADACVLAIGQQRRPVVPARRRRRRAHAGRHDPGRPRDAGHLGAGHLRRRRRGLRPAQPDRGGRQRQARGALDPRVPRRRARAGSRRRSTIEKLPTATTA